MAKNIKFEEETLKCFKGFASDYGFDIILFDKIIDEIQLVNDKCIIRFVYDFGSIECSFIDPLEKLQKEKIIRKDGLPSGVPNYKIFSVWKFLYPNDKVNYSYPGWDIEGQVAAHKRMLEERLLNVVKGDFSWTAAYKNNPLFMTKH